jgi:hypothetical protein
VSLLLFSCQLGRALCVPDRKPQPQTLIPHTTNPHSSQIKEHSVKKDVGGLMNDDLLKIVGSCLGFRVHGPASHLDLRPHQPTCIPNFPRIFAHVYRGLCPPRNPKSEPQTPSAGLVSAFVEEPLAEEALEYSAQSIHPAHGAQWLERLREFMQVYFRQSRSVKVRVRALEELEKLLDNWRIMYEQQLVDTAVLPFFEALPYKPWPPTVWRRVLQLLVTLARRMQCARFTAVLSIIRRTSLDANDLELRLAAVVSRVVVLPACACVKVLDWRC